MAELKKGEESINLREKVEVIGIAHKDTKKQKLEVGKVYKVHPIQAANLVETGHAKLADKKGK